MVVVVAVVMAKNESGENNLGILFLLMHDLDK